MDKYISKFSGPEIDEGIEKVQEIEQELTEHKET